MSSPFRWLGRLFSRFSSRRSRSWQRPTRPRNWDRYLLQLERLEDRLAPATVTYTQTSGLLVFDGLPTADVVSVAEPAANQVTIQVGNADSISLAGDAATSADFSLSTTTNADDTLTINTASGHAPLVN